MKKSMKALKKELALQDVKILKIHLRELLRIRSQKVKVPILKALEDLENDIKDI